MLFDPRAAKALAPGAHLLVVGCDGLRLVASASCKTWTYRYKSDAGKMKQVAFGRWPAMPVQEAVTRWQELRAQRAGGNDPVESKKLARRANVAQAVDGTVRGVVEAYAKSLKNLRQPAGAMASERALMAFLDRHPDLASSSAESLSRAHAFAAIDLVKSTPTAAAKLRGLLAAAWDEAIDSGRIDPSSPNWWRLVHRGKLKSKGKIVGGEHVGQRRRVLSAAEVGALLRWLPNMSPNGADAVVMYLWTGLRGAEIFGICPDWVAQEPDGWWVTVPKRHTKNASNPHASDHRVPLFGRAFEVVMRRLDSASKTAEGLVWPNDVGRHYTQKAFGTYIYHLMPYSDKARNRAGQGLLLPVVDWTPHHLRKTARTLLAEIGCPKDVAEAILGHLPPVIEATYNAYGYDKERRHWIKLLSEHLEFLAAAPVQR